MSKVIVVDADGKKIPSKAGKKKAASEEE